jgi:hypothetical protein
VSWKMRLRRRMCVAMRWSFQIWFIRSSPAAHPCTCEQCRGSEPRLMKNQSTAYDARGRKKAAFVVLSSPRWRVIKWSTCLCPPWCSPMQPVICEAISPDALASNVVINAQVQGGLHGSPLHGTMA